jgi:hypothetical protein
MDARNNAPDVCVPIRISIFQTWSQTASGHKTSKRFSLAALVGLAILPLSKYFSFRAVDFRH